MLLHAMSTCNLQCSQHKRVHQNMLVFKKISSLLLYFPPLLSSPLLSLLFFLLYSPLLILFLSPLLCSLLVSSPLLSSSLLSCSLFTLSFRTSRFPGASRSHSGGHEEQERSEFGGHPSGHETLPVPAELLRAGNHPGRLHPRRCSGPGMF